MIKILPKVLSTDKKFEVIGFGAEWEKEEIEKSQCNNRVITSKKIGLLKARLCEVLAFLQYTRAWSIFTTVSCATVSHAGLKYLLDPFLKRWRHGIDKKRGNVIARFKQSRCRIGLAIFRRRLDKQYHCPSLTLKSCLESFPLWSSWL